MLLIIIDFPYHSLSSLYHYPPACTGLPSLEAGLQMVHGGSRLLGQRIKKLSPHRVKNSWVKNLFGRIHLCTNKGTQGLFSLIV